MVDGISRAMDGIAISSRTRRTSIAMKGITPRNTTPVRTSGTIEIGGLTTALSLHRAGIEVDTL
jgi:hypothetical protein